MGVGVFYSDFDKTGGTIITSFDYENYDDYVESAFNEYKNSIVFDEDDDVYLVDGIRFSSKVDAVNHCLEEDGNSTIPDEQTFHTDRSYDNDERLISTLHGVANDLGWVEFRQSENQRMEMDRDFMLVASSSSHLFEIGIRGWEGDTIVGVAAGTAIKNILDEEDNLAAISEFGMSVSQLRDAYLALSNKVQDYVRHSIQMDGIEARFRTSGYTTSEYTALEDPVTYLQALMVEIGNDEKSLLDANKNMMSASPANKLEIIKLITTDAHMSDVNLYIPAYDPDEKAVCLFQVENDERISAVSTIVDTSIIEKYIDEKEVVFITPETDPDWFAAEAERQFSNMKQGVLITLPQFFEANDVNQVVAADANGEYETFYKQKPLKFGI